MGATENRKLLAEKEVLGNEPRPRPERGEQRAKCSLKDCEHPREGRAGRSPCHPRIATADTVCWPSAHAARALREGLANEFFVTTGQGCSRGRRMPGRIPSVHH